MSVSTIVEIAGKMAPLITGAADPALVQDTITTDTIYKPNIEVVTPYDTTLADTGKNMDFYDALDSIEVKPESGFRLGTAQAGVTTNGDIKDRIVVDLDDLYFRNEVYLTKIGSEHWRPVAVVKLAKDDKLYLKDAKAGVINTSIPEMLGGSGRVHVSVNNEEITGLCAYSRNLTDDIILEITGESTFSLEDKPFMYIEGELQKYFKSGVYLFTRGEIDNQGLENKLIFGIGYSPR
jgi:hypothetical protein